MSGVPDLHFAHVWEPPPAPEAPTLLLLHASGGTEHDLLGLGRTLLPGAGLLAPRGRVVERGSVRFFKRLGMGLFDEADLTKQTHALVGFIEQSSNTYGFDVHDVAAIGMSSGANIAAAILLLCPGALRRAVLFRPTVPLEPKAMPNLAGHAVFIAAGSRDVSVPIDKTQRLASMLRDAGADLTLRWSPVGHDVTPSDTDAARQWLEGTVSF